MAIAQPATYVMLAPQHPLRITYVLKITIVCMEQRWQHHARAVHSALLKEESRAPTAQLVKLDRYAQETRSLKIAHSVSTALLKLEKLWLAQLVHMVTRLS